MKIWKRNAIVATVLVLICAGVYLNWNESNQTAVDLTDTLDAEQVMSQTVIDMPEETVSTELDPEDSFAQIRLSRQVSRDGAVEMLQETMAYEDSSEEGIAAAQTLDELVNSALSEAQIESLVIAKGYRDCVAYMADDGISIAVSAPEGGLSDADIALISDIVTTQTDYALSNIRIFEVK